MKVGILTFHKANSYGANLQAYALYNVLHQLGCDVEIIDYRCKAIEDVYKSECFPKIRKNIVAYIRNVFIYSCVHKDDLKKINQFNKFRSRMNMSTSVLTMKDKISIEQRYDIIITGSDQIWNTKLTKGPNDWYCYKKQSNEQLVVASYAASVGSVVNFSENEKYFLPILKEYNYIGVRENDLQQYLQDKLKCKVYQTLDPTLLIDNCVWDKLAGDTPIVEGNYILNFDVQKNLVSEKFAELYAEKNNRKIVVFDVHTLSFGRKIAVRDAGPIEFLNIIKFADAIVSSSFHGIALSISFHKKIFPSLHPTTGVRVLSLLKNLGLEEQVIYSSSDYMKALKNGDIDYLKVENKLSSLRKDSMSYLFSIVKQ